MNRPSPPYPANKCNGLIKVGNNGVMYESVPDKNGIHKWVVSKHKSTRKSRRSSRKSSRKSRRSSRKSTRK